MVIALSVRAWKTLPAKEVENMGHLIVALMYVVLCAVAVARALARHA
jgi:hypothetical protein